MVFETDRLIYGAIVFVGMIAPICGIIVGAVIFARRKDTLKKEIHEKYQKAQEKGGISSLYFKHEGKQLFKRTFGLPILIGFVLGLILMLLGFSRL